MLKIMIVDDVSIFLDYLRGFIDWETYGFQICGEASDGVEALKLIEEVSPDILLTDITMPYMDGLTLAEKVAKHYPNISTILITGNSEFEYARKALKIGVCDYIVKPFEKEELLLSLLKQKDHINQALEARTLQNALEQEQRELRLRKLILGRHRSWAEHKASLEKSGVNFISDYFLVASLKASASQLDQIEEIHDWESIIVDMLRGRIEVDGQVYVFNDYENNMIVLMNFANENEMKKYKSYDLSDIQKIIKKQLDIDFTLGISEPCYGIDQIKVAYSQAMGSSQTSNLLYSWDIIDRLNKGLDQLNEELICRTLADEFDYFRDNLNGRNPEVLFSGLLSILYTNIINSGRTIESIYGADFSPYQRLTPGIGLEEIQRVMESFYLQAIHYREKNASTKAAQIVQAVKAYIDKHYQDSDLSISDISTATLINQTYLRSNFKSETGMTISEYITKYRMTLAKQLLEEPEAKVSQVAELVGYSDESYFSKAFKKYYGSSPKAFCS